MSITQSTMEAFLDGNKTQVNPCEVMGKLETNPRDKIRALWMPAQFGKTAKVQDMIRENHSTENCINILICSNIKLLVSQTTSRMSNDLFLPNQSDTSDTDSEISSASDERSDDRIDGDVFAWMSGKKSNISVRELADRIKEDEVTMVVCCAHKTRIRYLHELVENLNSSKNFKKVINIWIDEADATVNLWSLPEFDFTTFKRVSDLTLVSATYSSIIKLYGQIQVIPLTAESTLRPSYLSFLESNRVTFDGTFDTLLSTYPEICQPGIRFFSPGDINRATHDDILTKLISKGFAVMILNGKRKEIVCPNGTIIEIKLEINDDITDEISKALPMLFEKHNLAQWPFAVTGHLCLGRGITFQSENFIFDYGLIPKINDADTAYQLTARMLGNIRNAPIFKTPTVFMSKIQETACLKKEEEATCIGNLVHEKGWKYVGSDEIDYIHHRNDTLYIEAKKRTEAKKQNEAQKWSGININYRIYDNEMMVKEAFKILLYNYVRKEANKDGFIKTSLNKKSEVASLQNAINHVPTAYGYDKDGNKNWRRYIPCYADVSDKSTLRFVVVLDPKTDLGKIEKCDSKYKSINVF